MKVLKWMKDYIGNKFYPYTHTDAVLIGDEEESNNTLTNELNKINSKINSSIQVDWDETDNTKESYIKNKPMSLPANGGNADTLDGKHANDFTDNNHFENHLSSNTSHQELFNTKLDIESASNLIKNISNDPDTGTITITRMDDTTFTIHIPKTLVFQSATFDETTNEIVITWSDNSQSRIPVDGLINIYTGSISETIQISISEDNTISAIIKEDSINRNLLSPDLQGDIQSAIDHLSHTQSHIPDGGDVGQVVGMTDGGIGWVASSGSSSLDNYVTKAEMNAALSTKIDQEAEKELISSSEKAKLSALPNIIFSDTIPTSLDANTICFVYETEEGTS